MLQAGIISSIDLIAFLNSTYTSKKSKSLFCSNDLTQYLRRGYIPHCYGGNIISLSHKEGKVNFIKIDSKKQCR